MKIAASILSGLLFIGTVGASSVALSADTILLKDEVVPGSYCHMRFPAVRLDTLGSDHPVLQDASTGDLIDYYGRCDENPLGQDQIQQQNWKIWTNVLSLRCLENCS